MTAPSSPCIFVTGIWKSGNHLAYSALNALGIEGPFNGIAGHLVFGRYAWAKRLMRSPRGVGDAVQVGLETDVAVSRRYIARQARRLSGKILGGHAAHSPELEQTLRDAGARMICIRRDPRDILVSFADWVGARPDFYMHPDFKPLSREERVAFLLRGGRTASGPLHPFPEILRRSAGWLTAPDVLQITFEDLIGTSGGGDDLRRVQSVAAIHRHVGASRPLDSVDIASIYGQSLTFNKGRSQRWKELSDPALIEEINTTLFSVLSDWKYEI